MFIIYHTIPCLKIPYIITYQIGTYHAVIYHVKIVPKAYVAFLGPYRYTITARSGLGAHDRPRHCPQRPKPSFVEGSLEFPYGAFYSSSSRTVRAYNIHGYLVMKPLCDFPSAKGLARQSSRSSAPRSARRRFAHALTVRTAPRMSILGWFDKLGVHFVGVLIRALLFGGLH